jgi:hypothetical protein
VAIRHGRSHLPDGFALSELFQHAERFAHTVTVEHCHTDVVCVAYGQRNCAANQHSDRHCVHYELGLQHSCSVSVVVGFALAVAKHYSHGAGDAWCVGIEHAIAYADVKSDVQCIADVGAIGNAHWHRHAVVVVDIGSFAIAHQCAE